MNPHLLLLEDDPVSAEFLGQALASLPATVDRVADLAAARAAARASAHDLWLFDLHLPDGHAASLLADLRAQGLATPAIALSADPGVEARGFVAVLAKPLSAPALCDAVRLALPAHRLPPWNEAHALAAVAGRQDALSTLRSLFLEELPAHVAAVRDAVHRADPAAAQAPLHRLKASCGFVGALPLLAAVRRLSAEPDDAAALASLEAQAARLLRDGSVLA